MGPLHHLLDGLDKNDVDLLAERAAAARALVYEATGGSALRRQIVAAYRELKKQCGGTLSVAVRSSATAEDLPTASFAGPARDLSERPGEDALLIEACGVLRLAFHRPGDPLPRRPRLRPLQGRRCRSA